MAKKKVAPPLTLDLISLYVTPVMSGAKPDAIVSWRTGPYDAHQSGKFGVTLIFAAQSSSSDLLPMAQYGVYSAAFKQKVIDSIKDEKREWDWSQYLPTHVKAQSFEISAVELHHLATGEVKITPTITKKKTVKAR